MAVRAAGRSDVGHDRDHNEDSFLCASKVFAVADGLGGHAGGEVASGVAVEALAGVESRDFSSVEEAQAALADAVREGNGRVRKRADEDPALEGMGTTMTAAVVVDDVAALAHVGDSRAYLLPAGESAVVRLTHDHTPVEEAVRAGELSAEQARVHPYRNMLSQALGLDESVDVETPEPVAIGVRDRLLLCSDGLTAVLEDREIAGFLGTADGPDAACEALVSATLAGGAPDNVTVVVLERDAG